MGDLRVGNPKTTEQFNTALAELEVALPWNWNDDGQIIDAHGYVVSNLGLSVSNPIEVASMIVVAVNTCGGYKAERTTE